MAASDNLHPDLFHGTSANFLSPGDIIEPRMNDASVQGGPNKAYATSDAVLARSWASTATNKVARGIATDGSPIAHAKGQVPGQLQLFGSVYKVSPRGNTEYNPRSGEAKSPHGFTVGEHVGFSASRFTPDDKLSAMRKRILGE